MKTRSWRSGGLVAGVAAFAFGLAACGGAGAPSVAKLPTNTGNTGTNTSHSGTAAPKSDASSDLVEWAVCMRHHGDPEQTDPTIDSADGINIFIPEGAATLSNAVHNGTAPCNSYLAAASAALRAGVTDLAPPDQAALVKYSQCMRANGVPNYPDPGTGGTTNFNGTGIDLNSALFKRANKLCGRQIKAPSWWISGAGPPGDIGVQSGPMCGTSPCTPSSGANRPRRAAT